MKSETVTANGSRKAAVAEVTQAVAEDAEVIFPATGGSVLPASGEAELRLRPEEAATPKVAPAEARTDPPADGAAVVADARAEHAAGAPSTAAKKGHRGRVILLLACALAVAGAALWLYLRGRNEGRAVPAPTGAVPSAGQNTQGTQGMPEGAFRISPEKQQLIGVQYGTVEYQSAAKSLRAVGKVAFDETKIVRINPKIEGWVEQVFVDFTGKQVKRGQPLLTIYSPDLVQTQAEYLLAIKGRKELGDSEFVDAAKFSDSLVESSRRRLQLWDITDKQIEEIEKRGEPLRAMTLYAPADGFVLARNAFPRQRVTPDTELYSLADLSKVWVMADVYEMEAADIRVGQPADVSISSYPGRTFRGKVTYINPQLDDSTRTLKVRVELPNPGLLLKPDMYGDVTFRITGGSALVVPREAVMDSGEEKTVFVALPDGYFEPRKVTLGGSVDNRYIVTSGLKAGERVVTSGNFLIDSESRLKSATGGMGGGGGHDHGGGAPSGGGDTSQPKQGAQPAGANGHEGHQGAASTQPAARTILFWYDPMHPQYKADGPGKAPDCGMDLVPKYSDGN